MSEKLPEYLSYPDTPSFGAEDFYFDKVIPFREVFQSSAKYTGSQATGLLEEEIEGEISDKNRIKRVLTGTSPRSKGRDWIELKEALEENINDNSLLNADFSRWYKEFCQNLVPFSKSREFRTFSIRNSQPIENNVAHEPVEKMAKACYDSLDEEEHIVDIFGQKHYLLGVNRDEFKEEFGIIPSKLAHKGYIGRERAGRNLRVYINADLVKNIVSESVDANPYTP